MVHVSLTVTMGFCSWCFFSSSLHSFSFSFLSTVLFLLPPLSLSAPRCAAEGLQPYPVQVFSNNNYSWLRCTWSSDGWLRPGAHVALSVSRGPSILIHCLRARNNWTIQTSAMFVSGSLETGWLMFSKSLCVCKSRSSQGTVEFNSFALSCPNASFYVT